MNIYELIEKDVNENTPMWKLKLYSFLLHMHTMKVNRETKKFIENERRKLEEH